MKVLTLALIIALPGCTAALNKVGVTTDKQDFDALIGKPVADVMLKWGAPNRSATLPDSTMIYTWDSEAGNTRYTQNADGSVSGTKQHCVKSLTVNKAAMITKWSANNDCSKFFGSP
jgi:hypothetical protein